MSRVSSVRLNRKAVIAILAVLVPAIVAFYFYYLRPKEVEGEAAKQTPTHVQNLIQNQIQPQINQIVDRLAKVEDSTGKIPALEQQLKDMNERNVELDRRIDRLFEAFARNGKVLKAALERTVLAEPERLAKTLPVATEILAHAKQKGTPLTPQDYKEFALPLIEREFRNPNLETEAWNTVEEFASHKTFINGKRFGVPRPIQAENKYFNVTVSINGLDSDNNLFVNCHVIYNGAGLELENVRFVNCTFDVIDNSKGELFYKTLLASNARAISKINIEGPLSAKGATIK